MARYGDHRAAKFVKFVHFHSAISSNLPQGVSASDRWWVRRQRSCPNSPNWDVCPPLPRRWGIPPHGRRVPQYARAGQTSWAILPPKQMRPPYDAHGPPMGDAPPFVRADRRGVLQRNGTPKNSLKLRDQHRQREPRKAPVPLCDGMVRRCENCGDTVGSVDALVEAWPIFRQADGVKSLIFRDWYRWWDSNPHEDCSPTDFKSALGFHKSLQPSSLFFRPLFV